MSELYDSIGTGYAQLRRPDPRIAAAIAAALEGTQRVINVGAGAGSYEPADREVIAVEPALTMIQQRPPTAAPVVQASAMALPFADQSFDAALAVLTIHHWPHLATGLREMRRVARKRVVLFTWDPDGPGFWLTDYFPEILEIDRRILPSLEKLRQHLGPITAQAVPIPYDCRDGFLGAYWRRPAAYLDPRVRSAISTFAMLSNTSEPLDRLAHDLGSGKWRSRYGDLLDSESLDLGYRIVIAAA